METSSSKPLSSGFTEKELKEMETTGGLNALLERLYDTGHHYQVKVVYALAQGMPHFAPNPRTYSLVLISQAKLKVDPNRLYRYLEDAKALGVRPTLEAFNRVIQVCSTRADRHLIAERVLRDIEEAGWEPDKSSLSKAVIALCNAGELNKAIATTDRLRSCLRTAGAPLNESVLYFTYPALLQCCVAVKAFDAAFKVLENAGQDGVQVQVRAVVDVLVSVARGNHVELTQVLLQMVVDARTPVAEPSLLPVLQAAARNADVALGEQAWRHLVWSLASLANKQQGGRHPTTSAATAPGEHILGSPTVPPSFASYSAMVALYAAGDDVSGSLRALSDALAAHKGSETVFASSSDAATVVRALSRNVEVLDAAYYTLVDMHQKGVDRVALTHLNLVLRGCANLGDASRASETFAEITDTFGLTPDLESYHVLMELNSSLQRPAVVATIYEHLISQGHLTPTQETYELMVRACVTAGDTGMAVRATEALVNAGVRCSPALMDTLHQFSLKTSQQLLMQVKLLMHRQGIENVRALRMDLLHRLINNRPDAGGPTAMGEAVLSS